jgi:hypothetical protein
MLASALEKMDAILTSRPGPRPAKTKLDQLIENMQGQFQDQADAEWVVSSD